jgi:hypothetical protein
VTSASAFAASQINLLYLVDVSWPFWLKMNEAREAAVCWYKQKRRTVVGSDVFLIILLLPFFCVQSGKKKVRVEKEENVTLGPTVREGEHVFGVAHIFASFNDTFVHVTDLSGKETMARVTGVVPLPLFCSSCYRGVHDFLWPVNPNSQIF